MQAFLITAYKDIEQLKRLIRDCSSIGNVYVHIDKRSKEIDIDELRKERFSNTIIVSKYKIYWGSYNHLRAVLLLMELALKNNQNHFFHVISGQDILIKNKDDFDSFFSINNEKIYMTCSSEKEYDSTVRDRYAYYYPINNGSPNKLLYRSLNGIAVRIQKLFKHYGNKIGDYTILYKGMIWASIPVDVIRYVTREDHLNSKFLKCLKHVKLPEEFYFQTIIMNSDYSKHVVGSNLRYTDWENGNGSSPAILNENDYELIVNDKCFFARKVDSKISQKLIYRISTELRINE